MDKTKKKLITIESILMVAKIVAAPIIMVIVEQVKGPQYQSSASEIMIYVIITMMLLGVLGHQNLAKALDYVPGKQDS